MLAGWYANVILSDSISAHCEFPQTEAIRGPGAAGVPPSPVHSHCGEV